MDSRPKSGSSPSTTVARHTATAILTELNKLKSQQKYLDANQIALNPLKSNSHEEMSQINDVENLKTELDLNLAAFVEDMRGGSGHALDALTDFQRTMMTVASMQQCQVKEYRAKILLVDRLLREQGERCAVEVQRLRHVFTATEVELAALCEGQNLLRQHEQRLSGNRRTLSVRHAVSAPIDRVDSDEVRQFDRFVADAGGHGGGWGDEEHQLFVKMKARFRENVDRIWQELRPMLTGEG